MHSASTQYYSDIVIIVDFEQDFKLVIVKKLWNIR